MLFRHLLKTSLAAACLLMAQSIVVGQTASDAGLVLRGGPSPSSRPCDGWQKGLSCIKFRMTFENEGKEPVIIINPTLGFGTGIKEAWYFYEQYSMEHRAYILSEGARKSALPNVASVESLRAMASLFDTDRPPQNVTIILKPGESFTFDESFLVKGDTAIPSKDFAELRGKYRGWACINGGDENWACFVVPYGSKLVYEFSLLPYFEDPGFLDKLAVRWRAFGILPVGPGGTYTVTSEIVRGGGSY